jgi:hypothetical protein
LPNYRYIATYARFLPDKHDANGQSLMAETGMVVEWGQTPSTAEWIQTDEPVNWGSPAPEAPGPEPVQEGVLQDPEPVPEPEPDPEPAPAPAAPEPPIEPAPVQVPQAPQSGPQGFRGHSGSSGPQPFIATPAFGQPVQPSSN